MKRSDVLQELERLLLSTENLTMPTNSYLKEVELAREILDFIEKELGMLPPVGGNKAAYNTVADEIDCTWEPEDGSGGEK